MTIIKSMIFFRSEKCSIIAAHLSLSKERGVLVNLNGEELEVRLHDSPIVRVVYSNAIEVQRQAANLGATHGDIVGIAQCDARFDISVSDDQPDTTPIEVVEASLRYATKGFLYRPLGGEVICPPDVWGICTGPLSVLQLKEEIDAIASMLLESKIDIVLASYGFGCCYENQKQVDNIPVITTHLAEFIRQSEEQGIYTFGDSDLKVQSGDGENRFLFCHESDVHCSASDAVLLRNIRQRWAQLYVKSYELNEKDGTITYLVPGHC